MKLMERFTYGYGKPFGRCNHIGHITMDYRLFRIERTGTATSRYITTQINLYCVMFPCLDSVSGICFCKLNRIINRSRNITAYRSYFRLNGKDGRFTRTVIGKCIKMIENRTALIQCKRSEYRIFQNSRFCGGTGRKRTLRNIT